MFRLSCLVFQTALRVTEYLVLQIVLCGMSASDVGETYRDVCCDADVRYDRDGCDETDMIEMGVMIQI